MDPGHPGARPPLQCHPSLLSLQGQSESVLEVTGASLRDRSDSVIPSWDRQWLQDLGHKRATRRVGVYPALANLENISCSLAKGS